ncbi:GNAT family N-acetyltransferase [Alkaliphilus hydrothermalis]|uniref:Ribosomal protein S18 acetylase RimI-like enzyme n=1 Tax=Alkaliphilus hydrothermalis TaxID=1482730 RepID=A0ABS2NLI9_9FIRM|nr:GNAT family N-acetyltransferase [Alkaliphilus hydrothermalis]MBM7613800.1 ribosomal protein S18 acetylase RimI-like enzyme [Alkaliphilus hydrothermalis]
MKNIKGNIDIRKLAPGSNIPQKLLLMADPSTESINDYLDRGEIYGAFIEEGIVGVYLILKTRPFTLELVNVSVEESFQGKGIGKLLVMDAIIIAKGSDAKTIEVGTGSSSIGQLALYQKCGFRITAIDKDFFIRHYSDEIFENGIQCLDMIRLAIDFK